MNLEQIPSLINFGASLHIFEHNDKEYPYYNPSIALDDRGRIRIAIRSCNFTLRSNGSWYLADGLPHAKTKVLYGFLDEERYDIYNLKELKYSQDSPKETGEISGLEDGRLFLRGKDMHIIGVQVDTRDKITTPASIAEYSINDKTNTLEYIVTHKKPDHSRVEKNWGVTNVAASFDFNYSPTQVHSNGTVIGEEYKSDIHGGTQLIQQPDGTYLAVVHTRILNLMKRFTYDSNKYISMFARYSKEGFMIELSDPFHFGSGENIEFAAGMVEKKGKLIISLGIRDSYMGLAKIDKEAAVSMLKPYKLHDEIDNKYLPMQNRRKKALVGRRY
jgi:hypothetical protein